jgi:hypothetical protein
MLGHREGCLPWLEPGLHWLRIYGLPAHQEFDPVDALKASSGIEH